MRLLVSSVFLGCALWLSGCDNGTSNKQTKPASRAKPAAASESVAPVEESPAATPKAAKKIEFKADDGAVVYADLYTLTNIDAGPVILLFHQAGWNAGEYEPIAPRLQRLGFTVLALDQRSGGEREGRVNQTVAKRGDSTSYIEAYPDLVGALSWAQARGADPVIIWGSSYSAALVFKLAAEHPKQVAAVLAFSPGEYIDREQSTVAGWAKAVHQPIFATSAPGKEVEATRTILAASPSPTKSQHLPATGVHGSSILRDDKNAGATQPVWQAVESFLGTLR